MIWLVLGLALAGLALSRSTGATPRGGSSGGGGVGVHLEVRSRVEAYRRAVERESSGNPGIWPALVLAVIARESSGDPGAVGDFGTSFGLMQIQEATWQDYQTATNDPDTVLWPSSMMVADLNIRVGSWTLSKRIEAMGTLFDGLRAYNCGVAGATRNPTCGADYARWVLDTGEPAFRGIA